MPTEPIPSRQRHAPLAVAILALLVDADRYPYEMLQIVRMRDQDPWSSRSPGTFYNTVRRIEHIGLIAPTSIGRDGRRPERMTYTLTTSGRSYLERSLRRVLLQVDRDSGFGALLVDAHVLGHAELVTTLHERRLVLAEELKAASQSHNRARVSGASGLHVAGLARRAALARADLEWLDEFLESAEAGRPKS